MIWLLTLYWQNRSNSDKILPSSPPYQSSRLSVGPPSLPSPLSLGWRTSLAANGSLHVQSPSQPSHHSSLGWVFPDLEFLPLCWITPITVWTPLVYSILERTLHGLYITLQLQHHFWLHCLRQHFGDDMSIFTHSTSSPPFLFSSTLNLTAVLTQLKMAPAWLLPGCSGAESSDHLILISLLDLSAAFDRWTTSYI